MSRFCGPQTCDQITWKFVLCVVFFFNTTSQIYLSIRHTSSSAGNASEFMFLKSPQSDSVSQLVGTTVLAYP